MYDSNSKGISYLAGFFMLIAFVVASTILAGLLSMPIWTAMTGESALKIEEGMLNPANSNAVKVIQIITAVVGFLLPALLTAQILNRRPMKLLGFKGAINWQEISLVFGIVLMALFVSAGLAYFNQNIPVDASWKIRFDKMEADYIKQASAILSLNNFGEYLLAIFIMAFLPALCEETLFRGGLQNFLSRSTKKPWLAIVIVSIIFSVAHFSFYGFLSRVFLGMMLGAIYHYSGKLWLSILAHFINNAIAISVVYATKMNGKSVAEAMNDSSDASWYGIFALPFLIALFYFFRKITVKPAEEIPPAGKDESLRNTPFY